MSNLIAQKKYKAWPDLKTLIMGIVTSVTHSLALTYLTSEIFPKLPPFLIPCILYVGNSPTILEQQKTKVPHSCNTGRRIIHIMQILLAAVVSTMSVFSRLLSIEEGCLFGIFILVISYLRYIPLQNLIVGDNANEAQNAKLLYRLLRILVIVLTTSVGFSSGKGYNTLPYFNNIPDDEISYYVIAISCCALLIQVKAFIPSFSVKVSLLSTLICFCSTVAVSALALYIHAQKNDLGLFTPLKDFPVSFSVYHIVVYSFTCCSVLLYYFATFYDIKKGYPPIYRKIAMTVYDNISLCQDLLRTMLCKIDNFNSFDRNHKRIFLCTTMYRESAHEMSRLLCSLKKVSNSKAIQVRQIHIESHIFLDNGANGKDVNEFGIQLLSLIEETFMMKEQYGIMIHTPYGIKLSWTVPGEMPLCLHLKDNKLVKGKKRWSQVMYMRYILNYRANIDKMYRKKIDPLNSMRNDSSEFVNVGISINEQTTQTEKDMMDQDVPTVTFETSSKASSFSDPTTITNLEDGETKTTDLEIPSGRVDFDSPKENKSELTLRVPRLHFNSKNRRSSFDNSRFSFETLQDRNNQNGFKYAFDADTQNHDFTYNFTEAKFRSSFNDIEFQYHKYKTGELSQAYKGSVEDEKYRDFILATDADMSFDDHNVLNLLDAIEKDVNIGGVCGRTLPIGIHRHPIVWLQIFDYAKDFWMIKSAQNIIGSVMCCPGCFSLFRLEAINDVIEKFAEPTQSIMDVFTKDSGEDRWMCTLMMKAGWTLRYSYHGKNTTFCPEETEEFMKQRRRWLLSDFANAAVTIGNLLTLMRNNTAFTLLYALYILQLFIAMLLYPGFTIMMLALGVEFVTECPYLVVLGFFSVTCLVFCIIQISTWTTYRKLIVSKLLILILGLLTTFVFISTSVLIVGNITKDITVGEFNHIENLMLAGVIFVYLYSSFLHPFELHLLSTGIVYLFYLPMLNILLPLYVVCNIVDQTWGTRDDQKVSVPKLLRLPKFKKRNKKPSLKYRSNSYESLSYSAIDLQDVSGDETAFWQNLVTNSIGATINTGLTQEDRTTGLRALRNKALVGYLSLNLIWVALLAGFYAFLINYFEDKLVYGIVVFGFLGVSAVVQLLGMTVYRISDCLTRVGRLIA
ncbi:uncharacterized protein LOC125666075 [Ostrea edulis]|uniref:uncharacterized protein LOC125666075 n=1 Tax=Ostrea edulis TaxID=37623 RepID=UPI0024AF1B20|nr:uncharacterized protein LOC125666075 [Ostrea edulis]